jgi:hypothetical protein
MTWKPGQSGNPKGFIRTDKPFTDALRIAAHQVDKRTKVSKLRLMAEQAVKQAAAGQMWAIQFIADRLDGKPVQESHNTHDIKRDAADWTRAELVALIHDALARSPTPAIVDDSGRAFDPVHGIDVSTLQNGTTS